MAEQQLVVVYIGHEFEAQLACNRLNQGGVVAKVVGDTLSTFAPHYAAAGGTDSVQVWIREVDLELAKSILENEGDNETT